MVSDCAGDSGASLFYILIRCGLKIYTEDKMSSKNTQKLNSISFLRFFAFLNIFLYHSSEFEVFSIPYNAAWAVGFFFILSGFLAGFWHEKIESPLKFSYWKNYIIRKFRKIYPFFLVTMILTLPYGRNEGIFQLFINLFLLQSWRPEGYFSYNGVTWFLSTIFFLYIRLFRDEASAADHRGTD